MSFILAKAFTFIVLVECLLHVSQWVLCGAGMLVEASPKRILSEMDGRTFSRMGAPTEVACIKTKMFSPI